MAILLRRLAIFVMKETCRRCAAGYRLGWRRLFIVGIMLTTSGFMLQLHTLPNYQLNDLFLTPSSVIVLYDEPFSGALKLTETVNELSTLVVSPKELNKSISIQSDKARKRKSLSRRRRRRRRNVDNRPNIMSPPPPAPRVIPHSLQKFLRSLLPNEALEYANKEIENAPQVIDDPELFAPIYRNVSVFKRSYDLMEMILKVYIYPDGKKPIFHQPHLSGIYASEGWFLKLIEENRQFVTKDPEKAHLFYLPYSARQLEWALYKPESHNLKPLSIFLKNYVNMLAAKYPFWNRTRGHDHFLVACHDWGPYTLVEHQELALNTIKALCNADISEGIFKAGKDVSLPETTIKTPQKPLRNIGGLRVSQRPILAFFAGNMHGRVRPLLLQQWLDKDEDMKIYGPLPHSVAKNMSYIQHMKSSKYCICPMGYEVNSPRIVEAIYYECVPVIIADNFALPFNDVLDWSAFSLVVAEKDIPKLKEILMAIPLRKYLKMQINVKMVQKHFLWNPKPIRHDLFHMILHSLWSSRLKQLQITQS